MLIFILGICVLGSIAVPFALHIHYKWPAASQMPVPEGGDPDYFLKNYVTPWCRFSPYVGGVVMGYILHKTKGKEIKIPRVRNWVYRWLRNKKLL